MKEIRKPVNERIAKYRKFAGYTQKTAAEAIGMNHKTYAHMERHGNPTPELLVILSSLYNVDPNIMLMGEEYVANKKKEAENKPQDVFTRLSDNDRVDINKPIITLTATEQSVIGGYRGLKPEQRQAIIDMINQMREKNRADLFKK